MNRVAIIILNWNCADDSIACAKSILAQTEPSDIIFADNNSSDNSVNKIEYFINKRNSMYLIKNNKNLGFAGGINSGLRQALSKKYDYIALLNPDATADKNWLKFLVKEMDKHNRCGITTGLMIRSNTGTIDSTGEFYTTWGLPGPRNRDEPIENAPSKPGEVFGATGGGAIYRAAIFDDIDMFDEDFFMYYEDVDLSFRAQLAGWKVRFTPKAIAYHKVGASSKKVPGLAVYNTFKNLPLVFIKNVPGKLFWYIGLRFFLTYWLIFASAVRHGNGWPAFKGILASIIRKPAAYKKRLNIQKNRKVSVDYIRSIIHKGPLPNQTGLLKFRKFFTGK